MSEIAIPKAKFDRKGRLVCPTCGDKGEVPRDSWLSVGQMVCDAKHAFFITAEIAVAVNDILAKTYGGNWRKDVLKEIGELPKEIAPVEDGGKVILPGEPKS
jgi:hypothetical protein